MKKYSYRHSPGAIVMMLLLLSAAVAIIFNMGSSNEGGAQGYSSGPSNTNSAVLEPSAFTEEEPTSTPYPRKPEDPQSGTVPTPTLFPTYPVPPMTPVPIGADSEFDDVAPTPAVGYTPAPTPLPSDPISSIGYPLDFTNVTAKTDASVKVVRGTISEIQSARWTTEDGSRPANPHSLNNTDMIFRPVLVDVDTYLKGSGQSTVMVMALGGKIGQDETVWGNDTHKFHVDDPVILFLNDEGVNPDLKIDGYSPLMVTARYLISSDSTSATDGEQRTIPLEDLLDEVEDAQK